MLIQATMKVEPVRERSLPPGTVQVRQLSTANEEKHFQAFKPLKG
jgi:hypothetical protein